MCFVKIVFVVFLQIYFAISIDTLSDIVETNNGKVQGKLLFTPKNIPFWAFLEIPYASPPVDELRFKKPIPPNNWNGVRNATENTKICWELKKDKMENDPRENEDCLYLNIYVPKEPKTPDPLSVMVYFTGGGFNFNDGTFKSYKPYVFIQHDVISVFINFRQGAFGFLSTGDDVIPGNFGLWDQRQSLLWVRDNIRHFGGDPNKVTIMGHSSGASSVAAHVLSKQSTGLFRGAIIESLSILNVIEPQPRYHAYKLGCSISRDFDDRNTSRDLLNLLKTVPASIIANTTFKIDPAFNSSIRESLLVNGYKPVIENVDDAKDAFLIAPLYQNFLNGVNVNNVSILTGITSEEEGNTGIKGLEILDENPANLIPGNSLIKKEDRASFGAEIKQLYTSAPFKENITAFVKYYGDRMFSFPTIQFADLYSRISKVYFYMFSYYGPMNLQQPKYYEGAGIVSHCAELPYLVYYHLDGDVKEYPESDLLTRERLGKLFTNFIKYLNPTPEKDPLLENIIWPIFNTSQQLYVDIDQNLTVRSRPKHLYGAWWDIAKKYYKSPINIVK